MKKFIFFSLIFFSISAAAQSVLVVPVVDSFFTNGKWYYTLPAATTMVSGMATPLQIMQLNKATTDITSMQGAAGSVINLNPIIYPGNAYTATDTALNRVVVCTSNTAVTFTIPSGLKKGFFCRVTQAGKGTISFKGSGATLLQRLNYFRSLTDNADIYFYNTLQNTYNLCGNLKP